jgi:uncharacterized membrane protein YgcG
MWGRQARKSIAIFATATAVVTIFASNVHGMQSPEFPSCLVPQGTVKAHYESGVHGIVGDYGKYEGADTVYVINDDLVMQCFCPPNGAGIQTNWWMVKDMDKFEKEEHIKNGWIEVPTGSVWNLENKPYLAKNVGYSCLSKSSDAPGPGPGGVGGGGSSSGGSGSSGSSSGAPSSAPGLASTGSLLSIYQTALMGAFLTVGGMLMKKGARS